VLRNRVGSATHSIHYATQFFRVNTDGEFGTRRNSKAAS